MSTTAVPPAAPEVRARMKALRGLGRRDWLGGLSIVILVVLAVGFFFGPALAPYDANKQELLARLTPPVWDEGGSWSHVLGTDQLGRDILSRLIVGTNLTLLIGFVTAALEVVIGVTLGLLAGYRGRWVDSLIMRWTDIQMGFPSLLLILLILLMFGSNTTTLILAIGLNGWMIFARLMRSEVRRIKKEPFVEAAQVAGMSGFGIVRRHVVPHLRGRIVAVYFLEVPRVILTAAGLSFLGLGVTPPDISWGLMIGDARSLISVAYWPSLFAGLAIVITVASLYVFASWLEPRVDPVRRRATKGKPVGPAMKGSPMPQETSA